MVNDKIIIYDDNCPLCCWYTDAFVSTGLLKNEHRLSFSQLSNEGLLEKLDLEKSKDEIPLLDTAGEPTLYGIDSLLELLGRRWPWVKVVANVAPINWFLRRLYKLVSYNRRIIVGSESSPLVHFDCTPHFNLFYRRLYLLIALVVGGGALLAYMSMYLPFGIAFSIGLGWILLLLRGVAQPLEKRITYWGVMLTPLLLIGLILMPTLVWPSLKVVLGLVATLVGSNMLQRRWCWVNKYVSSRSRSL